VWGGWGGLSGPEIELSPAITSRSYRIYRGPLDAITGLVFDVEGPMSVGVLVSYGDSDEDQDGMVQSEERELGFYSPSLWWPDDRAWFVHTDVDARSTYIGGSEALIDALLSDPQLEVLPATLDHPFDGLYQGMPRLVE
jgi:hypothetical protein